MARSLAFAWVWCLVGCTADERGLPAPLGADAAPDVDAIARLDAGGLADGSGPPEDAPRPQTDASPDAGAVEPSSGCGAPLAPGTTDGTIEIAGVTRRYRLRVPAGYDPDVPVALVFAWHGAGGTGVVVSEGAARPFERAAGAEAVFLYPDGLVRAETGRTGWDIDPAGDDFAFFDALVALAQARACVDPRRVWSYGFSFGAYMSNALGCFRSGVVSAVGPWSGGGPFGTCGRPVAAWLSHGTDDRVVSVAMGRASRDVWLSTNGCDPASARPTEPAPCVTYSGCTAPVVWCENAGLAHAWPPYAAESTWAFFASLAPAP